MNTIPSSGSLVTPVVIIIFNRPDFTQRLIEAVAAVRPEKLFVIADGPRAQRPDDQDTCRAARAALSAIDWDCEIRTDFSDVNLGPGRRIGSGLTSVFAQVDRAIILEDDCLPHPTFFRFCEELLDRYEDDQRIQTISGSSFLFGKTRTADSYHFSKFHHLLGWATWRRSWEKFDFSMRLWPKVRDEGWLDDMLRERELVRFWATRFNLVHSGSLNSWVYPYQFAAWLENSLSITPNRNLVSNIGFDERATNSHFRARFAGQPTEAMPFPLAHPAFVVEDRLSDRETFRNRFLPERGSWSWRLMRRLYYRAIGKPNPFVVKVSPGRLSYCNKRSASKAR